jgi:selenide,water dikinase
MLADFSGCEDAGLMRISENLALVQTVDFFPPIVDDPFLFGRIAAANALSDIYAMGGLPLSALALVCFPVKTLGLPALRAMMEGGLEALVEAGCALLGGHSIEDPEPKLGYAVTGTVDPSKVWRNNTLSPGLSLILTKPIGTGLVNMALKAGCVSDRARAAACASMSALNGAAARILSRFQVAACTDVTGFGLAGHAAEMAAGKVCGLRLYADAIPYLPDAREYASMGLVPEGAWRNREGRGTCIPNLAELSPILVDLLFDPQTSGGLLAAVPESLAASVLAAFAEEGLAAAIVGESGGNPGELFVVA